MCGFIAVKSGAAVHDEQVRRRGPDGEKRLTIGGLELRHYLLHVTGEPTPQPFRQGDVVCMFNGEIYNHPFQRSDGEVLIPLYEKFGPEFARHLDGEFAIALYDFGRGHAVFATDPFGTKPLFVRGVECSSYRSAVPGDLVPPNTTLVRRLDGADVGEFRNHEFDFSNQHKGTYDAWIDALGAAVRKRAKAGCFVMLSGGYDSGAVACELLRQGVEFSAYSIKADERPDVLLERQARTKSTLFELSLDDYAAHTRLLREECEQANLLDESGLEMHCEHLFQDPGAVGASFLFAHARARGQKVHLSGHGGDEILADYGHKPNLSSLHGVFPRELMPWKNFSGGCMRAYLTKEEYVAGAHGIETRYPLLDTRLVQEFLWLSPELKNRRHKAPIHEYFVRNGFPFAEGWKVGFSADRNLLNSAGDARLGALFSWRKRRYLFAPAESKRSDIA
jgi:asparagine synthetase B (glutamine-hydrolysing)